MYQILRPSTLTWAFFQLNVSILFLILYYLAICSLLSLSSFSVTVLQYLIDNSPYGCVIPQLSNLISMKTVPCNQDTHGNNNDKNKKHKTTNIVNNKCIYGIGNDANDDEIQLP